MGQNQWCHFGVGAPPILVYFSGDWDVHWGNDLAVDPWPGDMFGHLRMEQKAARECNMWERGPLLMEHT